MPTNRLTLFTSTVTESTTANAGWARCVLKTRRTATKPSKRKSELIDAEKLAGVVREHRIPLVFLEACQSASEERPTASVAAKLLDQGVTSVVAMTHSVLVETARRFVTTFYAELAEGKRDRDCDARRTERALRR